jgi:hypothetical protein
MVSAEMADDADDADVIECLMFLGIYLDGGWAMCLNSARPGEWVEWVG